MIALYFDKEMSVKYYGNPDFYDEYSGFPKITSLLNLQMSHLAIDLDDMKVIKNRYTGEQKVMPWMGKYIRDVNAYFQKKYEFKESFEI